MVCWPGKFILEQKHVRPETTGRSNVCERTRSQIEDLVALGETSGPLRRLAELPVT